MGCKFFTSLLVWCVVLNLTDQNAVSAQHSLLGFNYIRHKLNKMTLCDYEKYIK